MNEKTGKLASSQKMKAVTSGDRGLRAIASELGVHHSTVAELRNEAEAVLREHWRQKSESVGRPRKASADETVSSAEHETRLKELKKKADMKSMRVEYLELRVRQLERRLEEVPGKKHGRLKKKRKGRNSGSGNKTEK